MIEKRLFFVWCVFAILADCCGMARMPGMEIYVHDKQYPHRAIQNYDYTEILIHHLENFNIHHTALFYVRKANQQGWLAVPLAIPIPEELTFLQAIQVVLSRRYLVPVSNNLIDRIRNFLNAVNQLNQVNEMGRLLALPIDANLQDHGINQNLIQPFQELQKSLISGGYAMFASAVLWNIKFTNVNLAFVDIQNQLGDCDIVFHVILNSTQSKNLRELALNSLNIVFHDNNQGVVYESLAHRLPSRSGATIVSYRELN